MKSVFIILPSDNDLIHHGIKGQKWGVRRYQNKDGSLTAEGRSRYNQESQKLRKEDQPYKESNRIEKYYGIKHIDEDTDTIKQGAVFYRITTDDEPLDSTRKYVSITKDDRDMYVEESDFLVGDKDRDTVAEIQYTSNKELKVATPKKIKEEMDKFMGTDKVKVIDVDDLHHIAGEKAAKKFLRKYGDLPISTLSLKPEENAKIFGKDLTSSKIASEAVRKSFDYAVMDREKHNKFMDSLKKQGYQAMLDINDSQWLEYPLVLLSPDKDINRTGQTYIWKDKTYIWR